jgi:hypothetical protein
MFDANVSWLGCTSWMQIWILRMMILLLNGCLAIPPLYRQYKSRARNCAGCFILMYLVDSNIMHFSPDLMAAPPWDIICLCIFRALAYRLVMCFMAILVVFFLLWIQYLIIQHHFTKRKMRLSHNICGPRLVACKKTNPTRWYWSKGRTEDSVSACTLAWADIWLTGLVCSFVCQRFIHNICRVGFYII